MRSPICYRAVVCGLIAVLIAAPASAGFFEGRGVKGSGDMETRELDLEDFSAIKIGGAFDLEIGFGDQQSVKVTIDDNLWDLLEADVRGGELELDWKKSVRPSDECRIEIVVRSLDEMNISGAGDVRIHDFAGDRFRFKLSGAADLEMDGEVDRLEIRVSGAGDIDTRDLRARDVEITISGAGSADVRATESIDAHVSGVGNIDIYGNPVHRKVRTSGLGKITDKD